MPKKTLAERFRKARKRLKNAEAKSKKKGGVDVGTLGGLKTAIDGLSAASRPLSENKQAARKQIQQTRATAKQVRGGTTRKRARKRGKK